MDLEQDLFLIIILIQEYNKEETTELIIWVVMGCRIYSQLLILGRIITWWDRITIKIIKETKCSTSSTTTKATSSPSTGTPSTATTCQLKIKRSSSMSKSSHCPITTSSNGSLLKIWSKHGETKGRTCSNSFSTLTKRSRQPKSR